MQFLFAWCFANSQQKMIATIIFICLICFYQRKKHFSRSLLLSKIGNHNSFWLCYLCKWNEWQLQWAFPPLTKNNQFLLYFYFLGSRVVINLLFSKFSVQSLLFFFRSFTVSSVVHCFVLCNHMWSIVDLFTPLRSSVVINPNVVRVSLLFALNFSNNYKTRTMERPRHWARVL